MKDESFNDNEFYELKINLIPDYGESLTEILKIRRKNSLAIFYPLPVKVLGVEIALFKGLVGSVHGQLTPSGLGEQLTSFYYKIRFTAKNFEALKKMGKGGLQISGHVNLEFLINGLLQKDVFPLAININPNELIVKEDEIQQDTGHFLKTIFDENYLNLKLPLDGFVNVNDMFSLTIAHSSLEASFIKNQYLIGYDSNENIIQVVPIVGEDNFSGQVKFFIKELNYWVVGKILGRCLMTFDLKSLSVGTDVYINDVIIEGSPYPIIGQVINRLINEKENKIRIEKLMNKEFQNMILKKTMITQKLERL